MTVMPSVPWKVQLGVIGAGYAFLTAVSAVLVYQRYMVYVKYPQEAAAAGGMYAFGDTLLAIFIFALFMVPTLFLVRLVGHVESISTVYAKVLLAVSITAPLCLAVLYLARKLGASNLADWCLWRLLLSPFILVILGMSRLFMRFKPAKRMASYALLAEISTFTVMIILIMFAR